MIRAAQKKYSMEALESWFSLLEEPWEDGFSDSELRVARDLYRNGGVRTIELMPRTAVIHAKLGKQPVYALVDADEQGRFSIRSSSEDTSWGRALAGAGIYEIEELIADELPTTPLEEEPGTARKSLNGFSEPSQPQPPAPTKETRTALPPEDNGTPPPGGQERSQRLSIEVGHEDDALIVRAFWSGMDRPRNALQQRARSDGEREDLIRFAASLRRSGFRFRHREGDARLADPMAIAGFAREELPKWRRRFLVKVDGAINWIGGRVETVTPRMWVRNGKGGLEIQVAASTHSGRSLGLAELKRMARNSHFAAFVPGSGIFRLTAEVGTWLRTWVPYLEPQDQQAVPRYLSSSLRHEVPFPVEFDDSLVNWEDAEAFSAELKVQGMAEDTPTLPEYLRGYQATGVRWMDRLLQAEAHPLLADEMGLGKTVQVLALVAIRAELWKGPVLVVCPASVVPVWHREIRHFSPGMSSLTVSKVDDGLGGEGKPNEIWVCSYSQLRRLKNELRGIRFELMVLDEAQFVKNPDTKVFQACLAIPSKRRIALTGTPVENRHLDLWALFRFLMPGLLGPRSAFENNLKEDPEQLEQRMGAVLAPFILRRTKEAVAQELPGKLIHNIYCPLSTSQRFEYERVAQLLTSDFAGSPGQVPQELRFHFLSLLTRLRQICCDPGLLPWKEVSPTESGKLQMLLVHLDKIIANGAKVVVFSQFVKLLKRAAALVGESFPELPQFEITGATRDRSAPVNEFQQTEGAAVFFASLKAGGTGITLHAAEHVVLLDPWWNPAVENQAIDRVHRIGQTRPVLVYRLMTAGTIEDRIAELQASKQAVFDRLVEPSLAAAEVLGSFSTMRELVELDPQEGIPQPCDD